MLTKIPCILGRIGERLLATTERKTPVKTSRGDCDDGKTRPHSVACEAVFTRTLSASPGGEIT